MRAKNIVSFFAIALMLLLGVTSVAAQDTHVVKTPIVNAGFTGNYVQGTDGSQHFRGVEINESQSDTVDTPSLCGELVHGRGELAYQTRLRVASFGPCSPESSTINEAGQPPYLCRDDQGRMRNSRPCRGN